MVCFNSQELLSVHEQDLNRTSLKREGTNTLPSRQHEVSIEHSESHTTCYRAIYRNERCSAKQEPRSGNLWLNKAMANHGCMSSHLDAFRSIKNIYIYIIGLSACFPHFVRPPQRMGIYFGRCLSLRGKMKNRPPQKAQRTSSHQTTQVCRRPLGVVRWEPNWNQWNPSMYHPAQAEAVGTHLLQDGHLIDMEC